MNNSYTLQDVQVIMESNENISELAKKMKRSKQALAMVRSQSRMFQEGRLKNVSKPMQVTFKRYFSNKGNLQLEEKKTLPTEAPIQTQQDDCRSKIDDLIEKAGETFTSLQSQMREIAKLSAEHQLHETNKELGELKNWKKETEPEFRRLQSFHERAKVSNFSSQVRNDIPF